MSPTWPAANAKGRLWCDEVNAVVHSEICAVPCRTAWQVERELFGALPSLRAQIGKIVTRKVDKLSCVRFGSARYSVPNDHIGKEVEPPVRDGVIQVVFLGEIIAEHLVVSPGETSIRRRPLRRTTTDATPAGPAEDAQPRRPSVRSGRWPTPSSREQPPAA